MVRHEVDRLRFDHLSPLATGDRLFEEMEEVGKSKRVEILL